MNRIKVTSLELRSIILLLLFMQRLLGRKFYFKSVGLLFLLLPGIRQNKSTSTFGYSLLRSGQRMGCRVWWVWCGDQWPVGECSIRSSMWVSIFILLLYFANYLSGKCVWFSVQSALLLPLRRTMDRDRDNRL